MNLTILAKHCKKTNLDCRGNEVLAGAALTLDDVINLFFSLSITLEKDTLECFGPSKDFSAGSNICGPGRSLSEWST
jgi:hypothetical protein